MLIVGGGPAGLSVAAALPRDARVVLAHADAEIGQPVRTSGGTWVRDMIRLGIPSDLYQVIRRLDFRSDDAEAVFDDLADPMAVMDVTGVYRHLAALSDGHNRDLHCGTALVAAQPGGRGVLATLRDRARGDWKVDARYVVDASGWKTAVLAALGHRARPGRTGVGYELEFPRGNSSADQATLFVGARALTGYGWVFPLTGGRVRLGVGVIHPDTDRSPRDMMRALRGRDGGAPFGLRIPQDAEVHAGVIPSEPYDPALVFGPVVRVGDSANMATPTVGEGIRIAIDEGRALGGALDRALRGDKGALGAWEKAARRRYAWNYRFGLMMNRRIARYNPARWDRSVRRLARLPEAEMVALIRSEMAPVHVARTVWLSAIAKLRGT